MSIWQQRNAGNVSSVIKTKLSKLPIGFPVTQFSVVMKQTNAYKRLRLLYYNLLYHIIYIVCLLHVSGTPVAILSEAHHKL